MFFDPSWSAYASKDLDVVCSTLHKPWRYHRRSKRFLPHFFVVLPKSEPSVTIWTAAKIQIFIFGSFPFLGDLSARPMSNAPMTKRRGYATQVSSRLVLILDHYHYTTRD
jgi:hypothetical protein